MARLNRGPNGPFSGKVGSVIGSSWKGIYYIKGLPKIKKTERSIEQLEQQGRFRFAVNFLKPIMGYLNGGFSRINPKASTGYNMAISHMLRNSIKGTYPTFEADYQKVQLSQGRVPLPETVNIQMEGCILKVNWSTEVVHKHAFPDDKIQLLIHNPLDMTFEWSSLEVNRAVGYTEVELFEGPKEKTKHVLLYLINERNKHWSNTLYAGAVQVGGIEASD